MYDHKRTPKKIYILGQEGCVPDDNLAGCQPGQDQLPGDMAACQPGHDQLPGDLSGQDRSTVISPPMDSDSLEKSPVS